MYIVLHSTHDPDCHEIGYPDAPNIRPNTETSAHLVIKSHEFVNHAAELPNHPMRDNF